MIKVEKKIHRLKKRSFFEFVTNWMVIVKRTDFTKAGVPTLSGGACTWKGSCIQANFSTWSSVKIFESHSVTLKDIP